MKFLVGDKEHELQLVEATADGYELVTDQRVNVLIMLLDVAGYLYDSKAGACIVDSDEATFCEDVAEILADTFGPQYHAEIDGTALLVF